MSDLPSTLRPLKVRLIRINYRHWGEYSGVNPLIRHFDPERIKLAVQRVPLHLNQPRLLDLLSKKTAQVLTRGRCTLWYTSIDLTADLVTLLRTLTKGVDVLHYLDGEHSLGFLPDLFRYNGFLKRSPRVVTTFHQPTSWLREIVHRDNLANVDRVTVVSEEQAPFFRDLAPHSDVTWIPLGVDVDFFRPADLPEDRNTPFRCLTVGGWLRDHDLLLELARRFEGRNGFELHLVSPGVDLPLPSGVTLHSGLSDRALRALYRASDVLLLPLRNATANNSLLEGIACGLPVVSTDLPGIRDYVPGDEAIRLERNDPDLFEEALLRLRSDREDRGRRARLARERALRFGWKRIAHHYQSLYEEVAQQSESGAKR